MSEVKEYVRCSICGDPLEPNAREDALCEDCAEAWERENESYW